MSADDFTLAFREAVNRYNECLSAAVESDNPLWWRMKNIDNIHKANALMDYLDNLASQPKVLPSQHWHRFSHHPVSTIALRDVTHRAWEFANQQRLADGRPDGVLRFARYFSFLPIKHYGKLSTNFGGNKYGQEGEHIGGY